MRQKSGAGGGRRSLDQGAFERSDELAKNISKISRLYHLNMESLSDTCEKFLVSNESRLAAELSVSVQDVIAATVAETPASPLYVERLLGRTTAPHGLTTAEIKRIFGGSHCMAKRRRQMWFATLGNGLQGMDSDGARQTADAFLKALVVEQKREGLSQHWLQVWECTGGLHCHVVFIGSKRIVERLSRSDRFGRHLHVRWAYDVTGLCPYLSKERTSQAQYGIGAFIGGGRKRGSHRLPGGGDRVRLSEALKREALEAGYVERWQRTNAKRKETRTASRLYRLRAQKAPSLSGQVVLFPDERLPTRLRDFRGGYITRAQALEAEFRRQQLGLSQHHLAQLIGLSQPHYANVVRGHDSMSRHAARRLKEALLNDDRLAA